MAAGTLASFIAQALVMLFLLDRRVGGLELRRCAGPAAKMLLATALMVAACLLIQHTPLYPHGNVRTVWAIQLAILMCLGATSYLGACMALGLGTLGDLLGKGKTKPNA